MALIIIYRGNIEPDSSAWFAYSSPQTCTKQCITSIHIDKMIVALLTDTIINGPLKWDAAIMKCVDLNLQCVLAARVGDLRCSSFANDNECLC